MQLDSDDPRHGTSLIACWHTSSRAAGKSTSKLLQQRAIV
jgi:hypothetical protein